MEYGMNRSELPGLISNIVGNLPDETLNQLMCKNICELSELTVEEKDAANLVMDKMRSLDREHFNSILLNTKNHVIDIDKVSISTLNSSHRSKKRG